MKHFQPGQFKKIDAFRLVYVKYPPVWMFLIFDSFSYLFQVHYDPTFLYHGVLLVVIHQVSQGVKPLTTTHVVFTILLDSKIKFNYTPTSPKTIIHHHSVMHCKFLGCIQLQNSHQLNFLYLSSDMGCATSPGIVSLHGWPWSCGPHCHASPHWWELREQSRLVYSGSHAPGSCQLCPFL